MTKITLWTGNTTGTIYANTSEYKLIGLVMAHNGVSQETILINKSGWQTIGTNYQGGSYASAMVAKAVNISSNSISQGGAFWVNNGAGLNDSITAVYGYK